MNYYILYIMLTKSPKEKIWKYIQYFLIGGFSTIFFYFILENFEQGSALSAYIYCAPTIYLIAMYIIFVNRGLEELYNFLIHSLINFVPNLFIIIFVTLAVKYTNIPMNIIFGSAFLLFIVYSILYFQCFYKKNFIR